MIVVLDIVVLLCLIIEVDLGDGIVWVKDLQDVGVCMVIGIDEDVIIDFFIELWMLEFIVCLVIGMCGVIGCEVLWKIGI